jgi:hypothetical protein
VFDNQISHVWKYNLAFEFYDWRQRSSYIPISMICIKISDYYSGLEITADQRSMIGRKLFLIGEEATLPFILIGKKYI